MITMNLVDINILKHNKYRMKKLINDIIKIIKRYLKCSANSCNNYGIRRLHHDGIYCEKCYQKILDTYFKTEWGGEIGGGGGDAAFFS